MWPSEHALCDLDFYSEEFLLLLILMSYIGHPLLALLLISSMSNMNSLVSRILYAELPNQFIKLWGFCCHQGCT